MYAYDVLPRAVHRLRQGPAERAGDPRAEPLLVHGPLLPRRVHRAARCASWPSRRCSSRRCSSSTPTAACSRCAAATRDEEAFITAQLDPGARRLRRDVLRGRAARAPASSPSSAKPGIGRLALESGRDRRAGRDPRLVARSATGRGCSSRRSPSSTATRSASSAIADADARRSSRPSPTRSSPRSAALYAGLDAHGRSGAMARAREARAGRPEAQHADRVRPLLAALALLLAAPASASAAVSLAQIGSFDSPVFVTGDAERVYVVEKAGRIVMVRGGTRTTCAGHPLPRGLRRRRGGPALDGAQRLAAVRLLHARRAATTATC